MKKGSLFVLFLVLCLRPFAQKSIPPLRSERLPPDREFFQMVPAAKRISSETNPLTEASTVAPAIDYPTEACFTYTYELQVGVPLSREYSKDAFTATNGKTYLVGQTSVNGNPDGLLQQLDEKGEIAWSKAIGRTDREEVINSVRQLPNGFLILIGTSMLSDGTDKKVFLATTDPDGTVQWLKTLSSLSGYQGRSVVATPYEGIGFVADDDSTIVYGRINADGSLVWLKRLRLFDKGVAIGITQYDFEGWFIASSGTEAGRNVGAVVKVHPATGDVLWMDKLGGASVNADYILHDMEITNLRLRITGLYAENGGPYKLFKLTVNAGAMRETFQTFHFPGVAIDPSARSVLSPWEGEVIAFSPTASSPDLFTFKMITEAYPDTIIAWRRKFGNRKADRLTGMERTFDGGYVFVSDRQVAAGDVDTYLLKLDSAANITVCDPGHDYVLENTMKYDPAAQLVTKTATTLAGAMASENWLVQTISLTRAYRCKNLTCPTQKVEDPCLTTFYRKYRSVSFCDLASQLTVNRNSEILVLGTTRSNSHKGETTRGTLVKLDTKGRLLARKQLSFGNSNVMHDQIPLRDGNLLMSGYSHYKDTSYLMLNKMSDNLELLWSRAFPIYPTMANLFAISESGDGSLFFSYQEGNNSWNQDLSLLKLDKDGNLLWLQQYKPPGTFVTSYTGSICQDDDYLYMANFSAGDHPGMLMMKLRKSDGSIVWSKTYNVAGADQTQILRNLSWLGDNLVLQGDVAMRNHTRHSTILVLDKAGTIIRTKTLQGWNFRMTVTKNQQLVLTGYIYDGSRIPYTGYSGFLRLDSNLQVLYAKKIHTGSSTSGGVAEGADGFLYETGYSFHENVYNYEMFVKKYGPDGVVGSCFIDSLLLNYGTETLNVATVPVNRVAGTVVLETLPYWEEPYSLQQNDLVCHTAAPCSLLKLSGPAAVCDTAVYTFRAGRNAACKQPVYFSYDPAVLKKVRLTEDSLQVQFLKSGTFRIKARIFTGCRWLEDSLVVTVASGRSLSLGSDTTLCAGSSLVLNAHSGFSTYRWQDGSTDSLYKIAAPGTYHVQVTDGCGGTFRDTIDVKEASPTPFSAGADQVVCTNDTIRLSAPTGFFNYRWSSDNNGVLAETQGVIITPQVNTAYYVRAEQATGCSAYDTVQVVVHRAPAIRLGSDTSFCSGGSLSLDAGTGFKNYRWSNGENSRRTVIKTAGTYTVSAVTEQGCTSRDTLQVVNVYSNPVVTLDKDSTLCSGSVKVLNAGNGYKSYLWNDGSKGSTLRVKGKGMYWVQVTDKNGCRGGDTTAVTKIRPLPVSFLPADTALCSYNTLTLKANQSFRQYLWSNGATASSITISKAGLYWLEVADNNSCKGRDSIHVGFKDCMEGFYVPTAFTPNHDGKNDVFRPRIFGNVVQYYFAVYNRWGEKVFETTEIQEGWDGKYKERENDTNVFVWICRYQMQGQEIKVEKGTVLLLK